MSITEMTYASYFFAFTAAVSGGTALIMYFTLDIKRCWQIVRGKRTVKPGKRLTVPAKTEKTQKLTLEGKKIPPDLEACERPLLLSVQETVPLGTMDLLQDITMMDAR